MKFIRYGLLQFGQASLREHEMATSMLWLKDLRDRWDEITVQKQRSLSLKRENLEGKMLLMDFLTGVEMMFHLLAFWMHCLLMNKASYWILASVTLKALSVKVLHLSSLSKRAASSFSGISDCKKYIRGKCCNWTKLYLQLPWVAEGIQMNLPSFTWISICKGNCNDQNCHVVLYLVMLCKLSFYPKLFIHWCEFHP